jgi:hypothetical protein
MFVRSNLCSQPPCNLEYNEVDAKGHPVLVKLHVICSRHAKLGLTDDQISARISDEADIQNEAYAVLEAQVPGLSHTEVMTSVDENGVLLAALPARKGTGLEKAASQVLVDAKVGLGKVVIQ